LYCEEGMQIELRRGIRYCSFETLFSVSKIGAQDFPPFLSTSIVFHEQTRHEHDTNKPNEMQARARLVYNKQNVAVDS